MWKKAADLVNTLQSQGKTPQEIINKLCEVADRYRDRTKAQSQDIKDLKEKHAQLMKDTGRIIQATVGHIQCYGSMRVVWYKSRPYSYHGGGVWKPVDIDSLGNRWTDKYHRGKYKVWIEIHEEDRDVVCRGITAGFLKGMTCITLDLSTQRQMFLNTGDEVTVTKVRK